MSLASTGEQGDRDSVLGSFSSDSRWIVFESDSRNFAPEDTNGYTDVYLHDLRLGTTRLLSRSIHGTAGNLGGSGASISADGRYVAFSSSSDDLVPNDANGQAMDMFVLDRATDTIALVDVSSSGVQANTGGGNGAISADGHRVAFLSTATNLVPGVTAGWFQVYVHDLVSGATVVASLAPGGAEGNDDCSAPQLSADGRFVTFGSWATNLAAGDTNGHADAFVTDLLTGLIECISVDAAGVPGDGYSYPGYLSPDGRYATFASASTNLVAGDTNGACDAFVRDRSSGTTERVSVDSAGNQSNGSAYPPSISDDGRLVCFQSTGDDLVPGDTNQNEDVFVHDRWNGQTVLAGLSSTGGLCAQGTWAPCISPDGRYVAFGSMDPQVVPGDTNSSADLFVRDLTGSSPTIATYCTAGTTTHGCVATIHGSGVPSASAGSGFVLSVDSVEGHKNGLFLYGLSGPQEQSWGASFLCLRSPLQRVGLFPAGGAIGSCDGQFSFDWNAYVATHPGALGVPLQGGEIVWAQALFRDPAAPLGTNLSDGLWFTVCP